MGDENVMLEAVENDGERWSVEISFRGKHYSMTFRPDRVGRLRHAARSPFALTIEGEMIRSLVERVRGGEALSLPCRVEPDETVTRFHSVHDASWSDWSNAPVLNEVWLESAERSGDGRWVAQLRLDGNVETFEIEFLPGPTSRELRGPKTPLFHTYKYDLTGLLFRMNAGERFVLPFKLRPRWPTPSDPPSLGSS